MFQLISPPRFEGVEGEKGSPLPAMFSTTPPSLFKLSVKLRGRLPGRCATTGTPWMVLLLLLLLLLFTLFMFEKERLLRLSLERKSQVAFEAVDIFRWSSSAAGTAGPVNEIGI